MDGLKKNRLKLLIKKSASLKSIDPTEKERITALFMKMDDANADAVIRVLEESDEKILEMTDKMTASNKKVDDLMMQITSAGADLKRMLRADQENKAGEQEREKTAALLDELEDV